MTRECWEGRGTYLWVEVEFCNNERNSSRGRPSLKLDHNLLHFHHHLQQVCDCQHLSARRDDDVIERTCSRRVYSSSTSPTSNPFAMLSCARSKAATENIFVNLYKMYRQWHRNRNGCTYIYRSTFSDNMHFVNMFTVWLCVKLAFFKLKCPGCGLTGIFIPVF